MTDFNLGQYIRCMCDGYFHNNKNCNVRGRINYKDSRVYLVENTSDSPRYFIPAEFAQLLEHYDTPLGRILYK